MVGKEKSKLRQMIDEYGIKMPRDRHVSRNTEVDLYNQRH